MTKCLETHPACQESVCGVCARAPWWRGHKSFSSTKNTVALDMVKHAQPSLNALFTAFLNFVAKPGAGSRGVRVTENPAQSL